MALEQLHGHPEALEALGSPLRVHHLPMLSRDHFVDITDARVRALPCRCSTFQDGFE